MLVVAQAEYTAMFALMVRGTVDVAHGGSTDHPFPSTQWSARQESSTMKRLLEFFFFNQTLWE